MAVVCGFHLCSESGFFRCQQYRLWRVHSGACYHIAHGQWTEEESARSSTWRELAAVVRVLKALSTKLTNSRVKWFTDNQNVARIVQVGSRVKELQVLSADLFKLALSYEILLEPEWNPRSENELADYVSRIVDFDDWMINPKWFRLIESKWGVHTIDRFASSHNTQVAQFNSRFWDFGSEAVDAFTVDWKGENNWLCPPAYLVPRVIRHAQNCASEGTLVVPYWRSAAFWPC